MGVSVVNAAVGGSFVLSLPFLLPLWSCWGDIELQAWS